MLKTGKGLKTLVLVTAPAVAMCCFGVTAANAQTPDAGAASNTPLGVTPADPATTYAPSDASPVPGTTNGKTEPAYGSANPYGSYATDVDDRSGSAGAGGGAGGTDYSGSFFSGLPIPPLGYTLRGSVRTQYETNFLRIPSGTATLPGQHKSDLRTSPLVSGTVNMPLGRQSVFATGVFGKDFYLHNTDYDRRRIAASAGVNLAAGTLCQGTISGNYLSQQSSSSSSLANLPNEQITKSYGASARCGTQTGLGATVNYRHSNASNSLVARQRLDLDNDNITVTIGFGNQRLGKLSLIGSKSFNRYPNQPLNPDGSESGSNIGNIGVAYNRALGRNFTVDGHLSRIHVSPTNTLITPSNSLGYGLSLGYNPPARYSLTIDMSRNASASPNVNALYFIQQAYGAALNYQLRPSIGVAVSAHSSTRTYQNNTPGLALNAEDKLNQYRMQISWQAPGGRLGANVFGMQQNRSGSRLGSIAPIDYKNFVVGMAVSIGL